MKEILYEYNHASNLIMIIKPKYRYYKESDFIFSFLKNDLVEIFTQEKNYIFLFI